MANAVTEQRTVQLRTLQGPQRSQSSFSKTYMQYFPHPAIEKGGVSEACHKYKVLQRTFALSRNQGKLIFDKNIEIHWFLFRGELIYYKNDSYSSVLVPQIFAVARLVEYGFVLKGFSLLMQSCFIFLKIIPRKCLLVSISWIFSLGTPVCELGRIRTKNLQWVRKLNTDSNWKSNTYNNFK